MTHFGSDISIRGETLSPTIITFPLYGKVAGASASSQHFQRLAPEFASSLRHRCVTRGAERARPRRGQAGWIGKAAVPPGPIRMWGRAAHKPASVRGRK